jgi:precorrin-2/cobalt-factor-2 C20-methyltransferase
MGILYGISVGTGDSELITLKGLRLLQQAPVIAFPAGVHGNPGMAEQIISAWLQPQQICLSLHFPYVQDDAVLTQAWQAAADQVWTYLQQGDVAFACEGDISFYSTFTYLAQTLQVAHPKVVIQTVPGVCSPMAAASVLGIPLTVRTQRLIVLPALYTVSDLEAALSQADVLVLMKVSSVYEKVWAILQQHQLLQHSHVVVRATHPDQQIYSDLRDRPHLDLPYFSILVVQVRS